MTTTNRSINHERLSPALGVKITQLDMAKPLTEEQSLELNRLLAEHCVIYLPNQDITDEEHAAFGRHFGELKENLRHYAASNHPAIMYVTNETKDGVLQGALPDGEMYFHADMCYLEKPAKASILYGINIPSTGGDTLFANMYEAYATLPDDLKDAIEGKKAINSYDPGKSDYASTRSKSDYRSDTEMSFAQPMVFRHPESGKKALYVNRVMTESVVGMNDSDSQALLDKLFTHQEQERFVYAHRWAPGDVVMWDNRCTLHARTDFDSSELRKLRRVTIKGEKLD